MREREGGVSGAESREGPALIWLEETFGFDDGGESDSHDPLEDLRDGFEGDNDTERGGRVVRCLAELIQDYPIGAFSWMGGGIRMPLRR